MRKQSRPKPGEGLLNLTLKEGREVWIDYGKIKIYVHKARQGYARLCIVADKTMPIDWLEDKLDQLETDG